MIPDITKNNSPQIFQRKTFPLYVGAVIALCLILFVFDLYYESNLSELNAVNFINTNIEILVTAFTVTMGVTLLGLQFRAQSYTMLALIQYIKDKVTYGFILVFLSLITFNMTVVTLPGIVNIATIAPYSMIGTFFSLLYLVGYIYYTIERIQPGQVLENIAKNMSKISVKEIDESDMHSDKFEIFQIWEQIMLRSVEIDNVYTFRKGMNLIFIIYNKCIKEGNIGQKEIIGKFFFQYISSVMLVCVRQNRDRFVRIFMDHFKNNTEQIPDNKKDYGSRKLMNFHIWQHIMREAIIHNNIRILRYGMIVLINSMSKHLDQNTTVTHHEKTINFFHAYTSRLTHNAISSNCGDFLGIYLKDYPKNPTKNFRLYLDMWRIIMNYAIKHEQYALFEQGIFEMKVMIENHQKNNEEEKSILDVCYDNLTKIIIDAGRFDTGIFAEIFLKNFPPVLCQNKYFCFIWHDIMIKSIDNTDSNTFIMACSFLEKVLSFKDPSLLNQIKNDKNFTFLRESTSDLYDVRMSSKRHDKLKIQLLKLNNMLCDILA